MKLEGKTAMVTGAQRGIGRACALALAREGAAVAITDLNPEGCQAVAREVQGENGKALALRCDVTSKAEVDASVAAAVREFGHLDVLVNNAGIAIFKPFLEVTEAEWDTTLAVNLKGQFLCAQAAAREMVKGHWGRIINIASVASGQAGIGFPSLAHYTASKGGVAALTEALAIELAPSGITVNAVGPGIIETEMSRPVTENTEAMKQLLARVPKGRIGTPEDVARVVAFLASDDADYINGALIFVDGGWLAT